MLQFPATLVEGQASLLQFNEVFDVHILRNPKLDAVFWMQPTGYQAHCPQPAGSAPANPAYAVNQHA